MTVVDVYSRDACHLCDEAVSALSAIQKEYPFTLNIIKIREGDERFDEFHERVPVIFINKRYAFQYRVERPAFVEQLKRSERGDV
jgi:hypothetical protein